MTHPQSKSRAGAEGGTKGWRLGFDWQAVVDDSGTCSDKEGRSTYATSLNHLRLHSESEMGEYARAPSAAKWIWWTYRQARLCWWGIHGEPVQR